MTRNELLSILIDAKTAIYMAESWAYSQNKLAQLGKARRQLQQAIEYFSSDSNKEIVL